MKLVCIEEEDVKVGDKSTITIGKIYEISTFHEYEIHHLVKNDLGNYAYYDSSKFIRIDKLRDDKLTQLGID